MAEDLREFQPKRPMSLNGSQPPGARGGESEGLQDLVEKALIADFFFIVFILLWFVAGLGETVALRSSVLLDLWYPLWPSVFQPALGVLMLGAIVSGILGRREASRS
jgi:hypothetical protein